MFNPFRLLTLGVFALALLGSAAGADECEPAVYLQLRPDVRAAGMNPWDHFVNFGVNEGMCQPTSTYRCTPGDYYELRPDVAAAGMDALAHYEAYGRFEGMCTPMNQPAPQYYDLGG